MTVEELLSATLSTAQYLSGHTHMQATSALSGSTNRLRREIPQNKSLCTGTHRGRAAHHVVLAMEKRSHSFVPQGRGALLALAASTEDKSMATLWCPCAVSLPHEGEAIQFRLDGRDESVIGTYVPGFFRSRWTEYEVGRVLSWRALDRTESRAATPPAL